MTNNDFYENSAHSTDNIIEIYLELLQLAVYRI